MAKSVQERQKQLKARMGELVAHMKHVDEQLDEPADRNWDDHAIEMEDDEVLESLGEMDLKEVRMIQAANRRIKDGSYGSCTLCSEIISEDRLDIVPATPFCKTCAKKL